MRSTGVAALTAAGLIAALGLFGGLTAHADIPDGSAANHPETWENYFGVAGIDCYKDQPVDTPYTVPSPPEGRMWYAVILKAGSENSTDEPSQVFKSVAGGTSLEHSSDKDISHVILCLVPKATMSPSPSPSVSPSPEPSVKPSPKPSVKETHSTPPRPTQKPVVGLPKTGD